MEKSRFSEAAQGGFNAERGHPEDGILPLDRCIF